MFRTSKFEVACALPRYTARHQRRVKRAELYGQRYCMAICYADHVSSIGNSNEKLCFGKRERCNDCLCSVKKLYSGPGSCKLAKRYNAFTAWAALLTKTSLAGTFAFQAIGIDRARDRTQAGNYFRQIRLRRRRVGDRKRPARLRRADLFKGRFSIQQLMCYPRHQLRH